MHHTYICGTLTVCHYRSVWLGFVGAPVGSAPMLPDNGPGVCIVSSRTGTFNVLPGSVNPELSSREMLGTDSTGHLTAESSSTSSQSARRPSLSRLSPEFQRPSILESSRSPTQVISEGLMSEASNIINEHPSSRSSGTCNSNPVFYGLH